MQWLEITVKTCSEGIEIVGARLTALGFDSFTVDDETDFQRFLEENRQYWDYVDEELAQKMAGLSQIRLYIEDDADAPQTVAFLREQMALLRQQRQDAALGSLEITVRDVREEDWENSWKQYYQPLPIGKRLLVVPQWLHPENPEGRLPVILDPGMIFGTGAHASTQMCLRALEGSITGGETVIDLGSGSGILSIAALRLGAKTAVGVDIDPKAEDIARENAAMNDLHGDRFTAVTGDVLADKSMMERLAADGYDLVLANIVADVIIPLSAVVPRFLRPGGRFLCSGILDTRLEEVRAAIVQNGMTVLNVQKQDDWCQITAKG